MPSDPVFSHDGQNVTIDPRFGSYQGFESGTGLFQDVLRPAMPYAKPCGCPNAKRCECMESMSGYQLRQVAGLESLTAEMANLLAGWLRNEAQLLVKYTPEQASHLLQVTMELYEKAFEKPSRLPREN